MVYARITKLKALKRQSTNPWLMSWMLRPLFLQLLVKIFALTQQGRFQEFLSGVARGTIVSQRAFYQNTELGGSLDETNCACMFVCV